MATNSIGSAGSSLSLARKRARKASKKLANEKNGTTRKFLLGLVGLATAGLVTVVASLNVRVAVIEGNRFTDQDAHTMERQIRDQFTPEWSRVREDLKEIKTAVQKIDDRMRAHIEQHNTK